MQITLVINDHHSDVSARLTFGSHRFSFNDIFKPNLTRDFRKDRNGVWVPFTENGPISHGIAFANFQGRSSRNGVRLNFSTAIINDRDFTISGQHNLLTRSVFHRTHSCQSDFTSLFRFDVRLNRLLTHTTTDVEGTHGELSTRLPNTLSSDNSYCHPFFNQRTG